MKRPPIPPHRDDLREDLLAVLHARRELTHDDDEFLVDHFLDRLDGEIDRRVEARVRAHLSTPWREAGRSASSIGVVLMVLLFALPLSAIGAIAGGLPGLGIAWAALILVVYLTRR